MCMAKSGILVAAMADKAGQPGLPKKVVEDSTQNTIAVKFPSRLADTQNPGGAILDYTLYMRKADSGSWSIVRTTVVPEIVVTIPNLQAGGEYIFKVKARQLNDDTDESDEQRMFACTPPGPLSPPTLTSSSQTHLEIAWTPPVS
jgi:hypothetical protein